MTLSGTTAHARVDRIAGTTLTWWVNAVSDTGEKVSTGMNDHHGGLPGGRLMPLRRRYGTTGHV